MVFTKQNKYMVIWLNNMTDVKFCIDCIALGCVPQPKLVAHNPSESGDPNRPDRSSMG